jgi:hypothetical protein
MIIRNMNVKRSDLDRSDIGAIVVRLDPLSLVMLPCSVLTIKGVVLFVVILCGFLSYSPWGKRFWSRARGLVSR